MSFSLHLQGIQIVCTYTYNAKKLLKKLPKLTFLEISAETLNRETIINIFAVFILC